MDSKADIYNYISTLIEEGKKSEEIIKTLMEEGMSGKEASDIYYSVFAKICEQKERSRRIIEENKGCQIFSFLILILIIGTYVTGNRDFLEKISLGVCLLFGLGLLGLFIITRYKHNDSMKRLIAYLRRVYRLSLNRSKQENLVWQDLIKLQAEADWKHGIYEKDKYVETIFSIAENKGERYFYMIYDGYFHCRVKVLDNYPVELATDIFVLAAHFNNLLNNGVLKVSAESLYVEYWQKIDILVPLLYKGVIYQQLMAHYNTSKDIYWAFHQLVENNEAPAIIIADLLKKIKEEEDAQKKKNEAV